MESEKVVDVWSQEAYQSSYRTSYCNHEQNFADHVDRVQSSNAVRLLLKSAGDPGAALHMGTWDEAARTGEGTERPASRMLVKESTYRASYRHDGSLPDLDPHLESFRPVVIPKRPRTSAGSF
ncbi:unnamed protein product [Durusdinium trenchii]|uniref:Uncharacterized protein n=1 Tax=Durusdinium trenchii TaxID=1381693 RepID=A0ABP0SIT2_9DINO